MKLGTPPPDDRARRLWDLFADEVMSAGPLRLMGLVSSFQRDPSWEAAPGWAKTAFERIARDLP
jgi:hypothetical protein